MRLQYVNLLAAASGFLSATGLAPVMRDVWGGGLCVLRITMWLHTTPAMVYLLSLISNFSKARVSIAKEQMLPTAASLCFAYSRCCLSFADDHGCYRRHSHDLSVFCGALVTAAFCFR